MPIPSASSRHPAATNKVTGGGLTALRSQYEQELRSQRLSDSTVRQRLRMLDRIGDPRTATKADVLRVLEPYDGTTRRQYLSQIRRLFADLAAAGLLDADPSAAVRMGRPRMYEPRPITEEELQRILAIGGRIHDWAVLAAYAGLRRFEVLQVEADHLMMDERGPTLVVPNGKGGTHLSVPAHPLVVEVLQGRQPGRLWPIAITTFDKAWSRAMQSAGLQGCTFHRLRHRFATSVYRATGDLLTTAKVCRHRSINTTQVYAKVADRRPYDAVLAI